MKKIDSLMLLAAKKRGNKPDPIALAEVEQFCNECVEEYNKPENVAKRADCYKILSEIGAKRRAAANMEDYPLPWQDTFCCMFENKSCKDCSLNELCIKCDDKRHNEQAETILSELSEKTGYVPKVTMRKI